MNEVSIESLFYEPVAHPTAVSEDTLNVIAKTIRAGVREAVNRGCNAKIVVHIHPNHFIALNGDLLFLDDVEGCIRAGASMNSLHILTDQGNRTIAVEFVGGGSLYAVTYTVEEPPVEEEAAEEETKAAEDGSSSGSSSGSSTRLDENDDDEFNSSHRPTYARRDSDSSEGEDFVGLSQLTI